MERPLVSTMEDIGLYRVELEADTAIEALQEAMHEADIPDGWYIKSIYVQLYIGL